MSHPCRRFLSGLLVLTLVLGGSLSVFGQTTPGSPRPTLTPPAPLESGYGSFAPAPAANAPVSIAPVPTNQVPAFYPPPGFPYDTGRVVIVAPSPVPLYGPAYVVPFAGGPALPVPPQPVPFATNFAPSDLPANPVPIQSVETRRPAGPSNLRISVSESFLNRLVSQDRVDPGQVRDVILGAQVSGQQTTVSRVRADIVPSSDKAKVALVLNGDVRSVTTGVTPQAMIDTLGKQQFFGVKEVYFDGVQLSTRHAEVYIRALNQTVGAMTPLSGTLFGGLADRIAFRAAERQKSAGEAVARDRLADKLFPSFDGEVDEKLAQANRQLAPIRKWLDSVKLLPATQSAWSTDTQLFFDSYISDSASASITPPMDPAEGEGGLRLSIHESLLNTFVDRTGLKGLKTTDKKLRELEEPYLAKFLGNGSSDSTSDGNGASLKAPVLPSGTEGIVTDIEFDEVDPMRVRVERDRVLVTIKAHFKPGGQALVPPMTVTIPYQTKIVGNKIRLSGGTPRVVANDRDDPDGEPTILEKAVQKVIEAELVPLEFDRVLPAAVWTAGGPAPRVTAIKSDNNGWITIMAE